MTISELRNRLRCVKHGGVPLPLPRSGVRLAQNGAAQHPVEQRWSEDYGEGFPKWRFSPLRHSAAGGGTVGSDWGLCWVGYPTRFLRCLPWWPDVGRCIGGRALSSGDDDSAALPPSGVVALSEPDPEMTAMLSRAAENVGLVWNPPPRPDPSRLDEWFLGGGRAGFQRPPPVPFFPEVHEELTRSWKAPFTARNKPCGSSPLTTLDGGAALGYTGIPSVERSVAMQLCPTVASLCGVNRVSPHGPVSTRQASLAVLIEPVGRRLLPYTPWRYCRSIRPKHWETCTRVGTTWWFYMSCVLRRTSRSERRRWPHSLWVVRCPRLWSRSAISGCVSLTWRSRRRYSSWMLPCHRPAFSATLSRAVPSSLRRSSTSCAEETRCCFHSGCSPSAWSRGSMWGEKAKDPNTRSRGEVTDRTEVRPARQAASASARGLRRATQRWRELLVGRWWPHHSLPRRRAGWRILCFVLFLFRRWPSSQRYPKLQ